MYYRLFSAISPKRGGGGEGKGVKRWKEDGIKSVNYVTILPFVFLGGIRPMELGTFGSMSSRRGENRPLFGTLGTLGSATFAEVVALTDDRFSATTSATLARFHIHSPVDYFIYCLLDVLRFTDNTQFIINRQVEREIDTSSNGKKLEGGLMEIAALACSPFLGTVWRIPEHHHRNASITGYLTPTLSTRVSLTT